MRVWCFTVLVLAGCFGQLRDAKSGLPPPDDDDPGVDAGFGNPNQAPCRVDGDCALAGATCCECPTIAVVGADHANECNGIVCPIQEGCSALEAKCVAYECVAVCAEVACDVSCADGYATDASGCLTCACAAPPPPNACHDDGDCVRVASDCCGCEMGSYADTAVLVTEAAEYRDALGCGMNSQCPPVNVCGPETAQCHQGQCALSTANGLPPAACGRPDLATCGSPERCLLNVNPDADARGVGVCGVMMEPSSRAGAAR